MSEPLGSVSDVKLKGATGTVLRSPQLIDNPMVTSVVQKLEKLPQYSNYSRSEKQKLASKLTSTIEMTRYFSDYLDENSFVVVPEPQPESEGASRPAEAERTIVTDDAYREALIESLSDFSTKLHIRLQEEENIQISLQVEEQLIDWTCQNVILPHKDVPPQTLFTIDLSQCLMKILLSREARSSHAQVDDRVLKLCSARSCLVEHIVKQITIFNRYYYYKMGVRDSQSFIKSLFVALNIDSLPPLSKALSDYVTELRNAEDILPVEDHTELDSYVSEHAEDMSAGMVEYMALLYYKHHLKMRAEADNTRKETWKCPEDQCQQTNLLLKLVK